MSLWAILVAAGSGERLGLGLPKALVPFKGQELFLASLPSLASRAEGVVIVAHPEHLSDFENALPPGGLIGQARVVVVPGGDTRQESVAAGLAAVPEGASLIAIHDAARPVLPASRLSELVEALGEADGIVPGLAITDTIKRASSGKVSETLNRDGLYSIETPQVFRASVLRAAHAISSGAAATDDASLVERAGGNVGVLSVDESVAKITTRADLDSVGSARQENARVGIGFDVHALAPGIPLMLGCVEVPFTSGAEGHSDGDVVAHALCDALLGAAGAGDLGDHFPSDDSAWEGVSGTELLKRTLSIVGRAPLNVDVTIICQAPPIAPHRASIRLAIASALGIDPALVCVKATTTDQLGVTGTGEGIAAQVVALLPWD